MRVALWAAAGGLGDAIARKLKREGHTVQRGGVPRQRGARNGHVNGAPAAATVWGEAARDLLRGARALIYVSADGGQGQALAARIRASLSPLGSLLAAASDMPAPLERLVLVSSAEIYGEGSYTCPVNGPVMPHWRRQQDLDARMWDHTCPICGESLQPMPTSEAHPPAPLSLAGMLLFAQERTAALWALEQRMPVVALRYFEVYGEGIDGAAGRMMARAQSGTPIPIPEDGAQSRDYVHVDDVISAVVLGLSAPCDGLMILNAGTGRRTSATDFVEAMERALGRPLRSRAGPCQLDEPRHIFAHTASIVRLGFRPAISLESGLERLLENAPKSTQGRR